MKLYVWGDSIARGIVYNEQRGRYVISSERWLGRLKAGLGWEVEDHSAMGATVLNGLEGLTKSAPVRDALCAVEFGGNDCDLDWAYVAEHPREPIAAKVPLPLYRQKLGEMVEGIRRQGMRPLLVTPLPLHAKRYFDWVTKGLTADRVLCALGDVNHIYRWQERYANAMREVARQSGCGLLDLRDVFLALGDYENCMSLDGIHPNDAGHRVIADAVLEAAAQGYT